MVVTLEEIKHYIRVDSSDEDALLLTLTATSESLCQDILRIPFEGLDGINEPIKLAILYGISYLYEYREEADFKELTMTLRCLLFGQREEAF